MKQANIETWRVVLADGTEREVRAVQYEPGDAEAWVPARLDRNEGAATMREAVAKVAVANEWPVAEVLAPGETSRAELQRERDEKQAWAEQHAVALRVVALWLGGPHHSSHPGDVAALARAKGAELDAMREQIATAHREGAEAMREAAAGVCDAGASAECRYAVLAAARVWAETIRALPIPEAPNTETKR
jgi:hypothetical protein